MRKKQAMDRYEESICWFLFCVILLIVNLTYFRNLDVSIGDPWLNVLLSMFAFVLFRKLIRQRRDIRKIMRYSHEFNILMEVTDITDLLDKILTIFYPGEVKLIESSVCKTGFTAKLEVRCKLIGIRFVRTNVTMDWRAVKNERQFFIEADEIWFITSHFFTPKAHFYASDSNVHLLDREAIYRRISSYL